MRQVLQLQAHRASATVRAVCNALYRISQFRYFLPELAHFSLQGVSDKGSEFRHIILSQLHVFLAVIRLQTLYFLAMLFAV